MEIMIKLGHIDPVYSFKVGVFAVHNLKNVFW